MEKRYQLNVFGPPELVAPNGERIEFNTRRQTGILTYLTLETQGHPVRRDLLVELFWPDVDEVRGRHSFSQAISDLRSKLGKKAIVFRNGAITLTTRITTELDRTGASAPDLKTLGEPLLGMEDLGGVSLSHWLDVARTSLNERLRSSRQGDLSAQRASGDMEALRANAERLYRADPLNDEAALALAEDLLLKGDETGASSTLRAHVARIKGACGGDPSPEISALLTRLATRKPKPAKLIQTVVTMVGRDREMASVESLWNSIREGGSVSVLIAGQPGLGKTTLMEKFVDSVRARKWPCYYIQCHEMGRRIPYSAISDLIGQLVEEPGVSGTDPALLAEASRVAPQLRSAYPGIPTPPQSDPNSYPLRVAGALFGMMQEITDGSPLLIAFDDIHNMDQASKDTVYVLYHRMRAQSAMFLCSARSPDEGKVVSRSDIMPWQSTLPLSPLDRESSRALLSAISENLESDLAERVLELGQDNPHMLEILINDLRENGDDAIVSLKGPKSEWKWRASGTMNQALTGLMVGLTANSRRLLDLVAVIERQITIAEAVRVLSIDEKAANSAALELLERGLVRFDGDALAMKNELHKIYVRSQMNPDMRRFIHARLAKDVAAEHPNYFDTTLEQAHHLLGAEAIPEAVEKVVGGASRALDRGAPREAETAIMAAGKAVVVGDSQELSFLLGKSLVYLCEYQSAAQVLESSMVRGNWDSPHTGERKLLLAEAMFRGGTGTAASVLKIAQDALAHCMKLGDDPGVAGALQILAELAFSLGDDDLLNSTARCASNIARRSSKKEARGKANLTLGFRHIILGELAKAVGALELAERYLVEFPLEPSYRRVLNGLGMCHTGSGDFQTAEKAFKESIRISEEIGEITGFGNANDNLGYLFYHRGQYSEADKCFRRALDTNERQTTPTGFAARFANAATMELTLGRFDAAFHLLAEAERAASESGAWRDRLKVIDLKANFCLAQNDQAGAWEYVEETNLIHQRHPSSMETDRAQRARLTRHHIYATQGWQALEETIAQAHPMDYARVINRLEVRMFEAWAQADAGVENVVPSGDVLIREATERGLFGLMARMHSLGVFPMALPPRNGRSSAALIASVFSAPQ